MQDTNKYMSSCPPLGTWVWCWIKCKISIFILKFHNFLGCKDTSIATEVPGWLVLQAPTLLLWPIAYTLETNLTSTLYSIKQSFVTFIPSWGEDGAVGISGRRCSGTPMKRNVCKCYFLQIRLIFKVHLKLASGFKRSWFLHHSAAPLQNHPLISQMSDIAADGERKVGPWNCSWNLLLLMSTNGSSTKPTGNKDMGRSWS